MGKKKTPATAALRALRAAGVDFTEHAYDYVPRGGTASSAAALGVDEHVVVKTLIMEDEARAPLVVLMHGDQAVSTKALARQLDKKAVQPCDPAVAEKHSGYQVGGTSPFGLRRAMPVYVQRTILNLERIYLNGGRRGLLVNLPTAALVQVLGATPVDCAR